MGHLLPMTEQLLAELKASSRRSVFENPNALIVEDDRNDAELMQRTLNKVGCETTVVQNGEEALKLVQLNPGKFKIMFLDLNLPNMPGEEVLSTVKKIDPDLHVIIVTGYDRVAVISTGYYGVVRKPLELDDANRIMGHHKVAKAGGS